MSGTGKHFGEMVWLFSWGSDCMTIQGHPHELSDSVKLLLTDDKRHGFEINQIFKSKDWHSLCQNFSHFGQVVFLLYEFEVTCVFSHLTDFPPKIRNSANFHFHLFFRYSCYRVKIDLKWKISWQTFLTTSRTSLI